MPVGLWGSQMRRTLSRLGLVAGSTLVTLLLAEAAVRLVKPQFLRPVFRERIGGVVYTRPNLDARIYSPGEFDTRATTTAQRFRGHRLFSFFPPPDTLRIAVIGDSYVFGTGAGDGETYPAFLESFLRKRAARPIEVINAGIHGSGTADQALWYERWVSHFHPGLVILDVYGGNDVQDEIDDGKFRLREDGTVVLDSARLGSTGGILGELQPFVTSLPGYEYLTQHSHLLYLIRSAISAMATRVETDTALRHAAEREAIERIAAEIHWLKEHVEEDGGRLVLVFTPSREALTEAEHPPPAVEAELALEERLARQAAEEGIPFLDLTAYLQSRSQGNPDVLYYHRDPHMRPEGYRVEAEAVAQFLLRQRLIPGSPPPR